MTESLTLETTCGTCRCRRRWHYQTYAGDAGCTREIGMANPVPCACTGFMQTEAPDLRKIHEEQMAARIWRAAVRRQDAIDGAKYRATLP